MLSLRTASGSATNIRTGSWSDEQHQQQRARSPQHPHQPRATGALVPGGVRT